MLSHRPLDLNLRSHVVSTFSNYVSSQHGHRPCGYINSGPYRTIADTDSRRYGTNHAGLDRQDRRHRTGSFHSDLSRLHHSTSAGSPSRLNTHDLEFCNIPHSGRTTGTNKDPSPPQGDQSNDSMPYPQDKVLPFTPTSDALEKDPHYRKFHNLKDWTMEYLQMQMREIVPNL